MTAGPGDTDAPAPAGHTRSRTEPITEAGAEPAIETGSGAATGSTPDAAADDAAPRRSHAGTALRGDIEGLRAIAVGTVLLYHLGLAALPGGFVGVDVFFVISGFLITSLLLREASRTGSVSIADFYARRARRLLPAASLVLLVTGVAGWFVLPGSDRTALGLDVVAATFYVINWALALRSVDYLAEDADPSPLQHYWSLSVEEQFYLLWPLLILLGLLLARRTGRRPRPFLLGALGLTAAASLLVSVVQTRTDPATAYFVTTTRVWELAIGALLAFAVTRLRGLPRSAAEVLAALGLGFIAWAALRITEASPWPGWLALAPTLGAAAIIAAGCAGHPTLVGRVISLAPMQWIGGLSYAIYLWHWPLVVLARAAWPGIGAGRLVLVGLASVLLAWLTKRLVEDPIRFHPGLSARASRGLLFGAASMAVTAALGLGLHLALPELERDAPVTGATALIPSTQGAVAASGWTPAVSTEAITRSGPVTPDPALATEDVPAYYDDGCQVADGDSAVPACRYGAPGSTRTIALLGDSKSGQWFPAVDAIAKDEDAGLDLYLKSRCAFAYTGVEAECARFTRGVVARLREQGAPDLAIVSQGDFPSGALVDGMTEAIRDLEDLGTKVVVLADSPRPPQEKVYACVEKHRDDYLACAFPAGTGREGRGTPALRDAAKAADVPFVDLNPWVCPPGKRCPAVIGGTLVYRQGSHITASYARSMTPVLYRELAGLGLTRAGAEEITAADVP